jgi:glycosyltransferase involved in cell wall biosynthesis
VSRISIIAPGIWHADEVAYALVDLGHAVEIVGAARRHRVVKPILRGVRAFAGKVPAFAAPIHMSIGAAARLVDTRQTDLAICWSSFALASLIQRDIPVVVVRGSTHIGTQRERLDGGPRWRRPSLQMVALEEAEYRKATSVTVPTEQIAADPRWLAQGVRPNVAPYGFPERRDWAGADASRGIRLIFGGEISYRKGMDRLAVWLGSHPHNVERFDLFGNVSRGIDGDRLPAWWNICGNVARSRWLDALRSAHILLLPSREEGMARVGQEAMACGVPVIATPEAGLSRWLQSGGGVELPAGAWEASLEAVLADIQANWDSYSTKAYEVASSWTWKDHASLLLAGATVGK